MSDCILKIENLHKTFRSHWVYRQIQAVKGVSLEIRRGEAFGFLGANGAGKTSTIKCVLGLIRKNRGEIYLNGKKLLSAEQRSKIGFLPELPYFYEHLSVEESLDFFARLCGLKGTDRRQRVEKTIEKVGLSSRRKNNVRSLSKGLQQRLGFAQAIINEPELLLLDEPFSGLDPIGRKEMRDMIQELHTKGTTIFLSSHVLHDVEHLCDRVSIMKNGELKNIFELSDIPKLFGQSYQIIANDLEKDSALCQQLKGLSTGSSHKKRASIEQLQLSFSSYDQALAAIDLLKKAEKQINSFESVCPSLEEIFVQVTSTDQSNG